MKVRLKMLIISIIPIIMIVVGLMFAIKYKNSSVKYFNKNGYVINNVKNTDDKSSVDKIYFNSDSSYVKHSNGEISFTNTDGIQLTIDEESFIHYDDDSIMALTNGVAIDLDNVDSKLLSYYNIFSNSILLKTKDGYEIENINSNIKFKKLMYKISNDKYLIASDNIKVILSEEQTISLKKFVEIEYVNENVIKIYNDEVNYQTIASNLYLLVDNIKIDLEYKTISKNNVEYLTMADMVINSNDNIEILPDKQKNNDKDEEKDTSKANNDEGNNDATNNNSNNQNNNTNVDSNISDALNNIISNGQGSERFDDEENIIQPKFMVENLNVTPLGFKDLKMSFIDESGVLSGNRQVQLIENSTGRLVEELNSWEEGVINYEASHSGLKPNSEYTINVVGKYKIENEEYDRIFVTKMFRTLDLGLNITEDYLTSNSISFSIYKNNYLDIEGFNYEIVDSEKNVLDSGEASFEQDSDNVKIKLSEGIKPNSKYSIIIKKIQYSNVTYSLEDNALMFSVKSLKENPNKNVELLYDLNSSKRILNLKLDGVNDPNGGIVSYTYKVYDSDNNELVYTSIKDKYSDLILTVGDNSLLEKNNTENILYDLEINKNYYYQVEILFDDNEKTIIYLTPKSQVIDTGALVYPKVIGYKESEENNNFETLQGAILIDNSSENYTNFIKSKNINRYQVILRERQGSTFTSENVISMSIIEAVLEQNNEIALPVYFYDLKPNTEYTLSVYLLSADDSSYTSSVYIGRAYAKTGEIKPIELELNDIDSDKLFSISAHADDKTLLELLSNFEFKLYKCSIDINGEEACEQLKKYRRTVPQSQDILEELNELFNDDGINMNSDEFDFYLDDYSQHKPGDNQNFKLKAISTAKQGYEIPVKINGNDSYEITIHSIPPKFANLNISPVQKKECKNCNNINNLDDETTVAYKFEVISYPSVKGQSLDSLFYYITQVNETTDCAKSNLDDLNKSKFRQFKLNNENNEKSFTLNLDDDVERGNVYCVYYYGEYTEDDVTKQLVDETNSGVQVISPKKQQPKITGYVSNYDGSNITFKLNLNDPDEAGEKICLNSGSNNETCERSLDISASNSEYIFSDVTSENQYTLYLHQKMLLDEEIVPIYDTKKLDDIVNPDYNLIVDTSVVGQVTFKLYSDKNSSDIPGEEGTVDSIINSNLDRIYKLKLKLDDDEYEYLNLENYGDVYYYSTISLDKLKKFITKNNNEEFLNLNGRIEVLYEDGNILDYVSSNNYLLKTLDSPSKYMQRLDDKLEKTKILSASDFTYNIFEDYIIIKDNAIGLFIETSKETTKDVFEVYSKSLSSTTPKLYDTNNKETNEFKVNNSLATSDIIHTYTSNGAITQFEILNYNDETMKIVLNKNSEEQENIEFNFGENKCNVSKNICITSKNEDNKKIVEINFNKLDHDIEYNYSIDYYIENNLSRSTYNTILQKENNNISISSLNALNYNNKNASYNTGEWEYNEDHSDIIHSKNIVVEFNVVENYKLDKKEEIKYSLIAVDKDSNEIELVSSKDLSNFNKIDLGFEEINSLGLNGVYEIRIRPVIYGSTDTIELKEEVVGNVEITNQEPIFDIDVSEGTKIELSIKDFDGMLLECNNCSECNNGELNYNVNNDVAHIPYLHIIDDNNKTYLGISEEINNEVNFSNKKVVNFELYKLSENGEETLILYSPIAFTNKTSVIDISRLMQKQGLSSGTYKVKIKYCDKTGDKEKEQDIRINNNAVSLHINHINLLDQAKSYYLISFNNPEQETLNQIKNIEYQYRIKRNEDYYHPREQISDVNFANSTNESGIDLYSILIPISEYNKGDKLLYLTILFKDENNNIVARYEIY